MDDFKGIGLVDKPVSCPSWPRATTRLQGPSQKYAVDERYKHISSHSIYNKSTPRNIVSPNWRFQPATNSATRSLTGTADYALSSARHVSSISSGMDGVYVYCLDRGNGEFTRLIPADALPPLNEIPARETQRMGMIVLPPLTEGLPNGGAEMNQPVTVQVCDSGAGRLNRWMFQDTLGQCSGSIQKHIDHIVATSSSATKKNKIYCDKWIHEGVCAFTQQGCKYKHEMPYDEATQHSLGLFQGFPSWWRKRHIGSKPQLEAANSIQKPSAIARPGVEGDSNRRSAVGSVHDQVRPTQTVSNDIIGRAVCPPGKRVTRYNDAMHARLTAGSMVPFVWGSLSSRHKQSGQERHNLAVGNLA